MKLTVRTLTPDEYQTIAKAAKKAGFASADAWLTYHAEKLIQSHLKGDLDLSPKMAAKQLNLSTWAFYKLMRAGAFPNLYYVNSRVVRIPQADIDGYKAKHMPFTVAA
jgi:predicted DNA-binding transcriptional regulator AlpA